MTLESKTSGSMSKKNGKSPSLVAEYASLIANAFAALGHEVALEQVESLAIFLTRTMGSEARDYHRPEHSLEVARD